MVKRVFFVLISVLILAGSGIFIYGKRQKNFPQNFFQKPPNYELARLLEKNGIAVSGLPVMTNSNIMASVSGILVIFAADKDLVVQVRTLQLVLPRLKMEDKSVKEIDLRFNKVVIR